MLQSYHSVGNILWSTEYLGDGKICGVNNRSGYSLHFCVFPLHMLLRTIPSCELSLCMLQCDNYNMQYSSQSPFPRPMAHRAAPISVYIALGQASANAVKATAGGWSTGGSKFNFPTPFSDVERQTRRQ